MGIFDGSLLVAGIIYHNYDKQHGVIEVSAGSSSKRWMTKDILRQFLSMPFTLLGCQTIVARHAEDRRALRRMWCSVGAVEYLIPRLRGRYGPCEVVSVLTDDAWLSYPFMREKPIGKESCRERVGNAGRIMGG